MEDVNPSLGIDALPKEALFIVFHGFSIRDLTAACCSCKTLATFLRSEYAEPLWQAQCQRTFYIDEKIGPDRQPLPSFRATAIAWHSICMRYGMDGLRAIRAFARMRSWLSINYPQILETLRPGAQEEHLNEAELMLGRHLSPALRAIYRVHDGQDILENASSQNAMYGLFGASYMYGQLACTTMLPALFSKRLDMERAMFGNGTDSHLFAMALTEFKHVIYTHEDLQIYHHGRQHKISAVAPRLLETLPDWVIEQSNRTGYALPNVQDHLLVWLETYADRLHSEMYNVTQFDSQLDFTRCISLFPNKPPLCREAVTQGIKVRVSSLYVPEKSYRENLFAYSVRFSLLSEAEQRAAGEAKPLASVQLVNRHWIIKDADGDVKDEVEGPGVVGEHPLLCAGDENEFVYQSVTTLEFDEEFGSMEGHFEFVEGSLVHPGDRRIMAECPRFVVNKPDIVF